MTAFMMGGDPAQGGHAASLGLWRGPSLWPWRGPSLGPRALEGPFPRALKGPLPRALWGPTSLLYNTNYIYIYVHVYIMPGKEVPRVAPVGQPVRAADGLQGHVGIYIYIYVYVYMLASYLSLRSPRTWGGLGAPLPARLS